MKYPYVIREGKRIVAIAHVEAETEREGISQLLKDPPFTPEADKNYSIDVAGVVASSFGDEFTRMDRAVGYAEGTCDTPNDSGYIHNDLGPKCNHIWEQKGPGRPVNCALCDGLRKEEDGKPVGRPYAAPLEKRPNGFDFQVPVDHVNCRSKSRNETHFLDDEVNRILSRESAKVAESIINGKHRFTVGPGARTFMGSMPESVRESLQRMIPTGATVTEAGRYGNPHIRTHTFFLRFRSESPELQQVNVEVSDEQLHAMKRW